MAPLQLPRSSNEARLVICDAATRAARLPPASRTALDRSTLRALALLQIEDALHSLAGAANAAHEGCAHDAELALLVVGVDLCKLQALLCLDEPSPATRAPTVAAPQAVAS